MSDWQDVKVPFEFQAPCGLVLAVPKDVHPVQTGVWLAAKGAKRIKVRVAGIPTILNPMQAAPILRQMDADVRVLIASGGVTTVFPRPAVAWTDGGAITINQESVSSRALEVWMAVWPSLKEGIRGGENFFCEESNDSSLVKCVLETR